MSSRTLHFIFHRCRWTMLAIGGLGWATPATAQSLKVTVENLGPANGFFITPLWFGLHDGGFDTFNAGSPASPELEALAEDGIVGGLQTLFAAPGRAQGVVVGPAGFGSAPGQPPVIDTGEVASAVVAVPSPTTSRYFSYASMMIPSNDGFIGNGNPTAFEVFNAAGQFQGPITITVLGGNIWDAGTEVNDLLGAAFSALGGTSSTEGGVVHVHPGLQGFEGTQTAAGTIIGAGLAPGANDAVARITIEQVPEPSTGVLAIVTGGIVAGLRSRFRRRG